MGPSPKSNVVYLLILSLFTCSLFAQNAGSIQGTVVDTQGAVVSGAPVQATDQGKGVVTATTTSGGDGLFVLQPLQPGIYTVEVRAKGMKELKTSDVHLDPYQKIDLGRLRVVVGVVSEEVTVRTETPLVETATADHSSVIDATEVSETSQNGRDFETLMKTLPGVTSNNTSAFRLVFNETDDMHVNGNKGSLNNFFLDGTINTDVGANDGQYTQLSMDAVGEFKVQTSNFAAEYGRNPGILMAVNTKSGTSRFHGTLWEFNRQSGFDSNTFFNTHGPSGNLLPAANQLPTPALHFNQWGANLGGPIPLPHAKNKLFFFFNYEGTHALKPQQGNLATNGFYDIPNPAELTGDFSSLYRPGQTLPGAPQFEMGQLFVPGTVTFNSKGQIDGGTPYLNNQIPTTSFSKNAQGFINLVTPLYHPNCFSLAAQGTPDLFQCPFQNIYQFQKRQLVTRIDFIANAKTNFFFRWVDDAQHEQQQSGIFTFLEQPILPMERKKPGASWSWNLVNVITPTMTNEFIFSYNHLTQVVGIQPGTPAASYNFSDLGFSFGQLYPNANETDRFPTIGPCCNTGTFSMSMFPPGWHSEARTFTWTDNLTKISGAHTLKTGIFFDYNQAGQQPAWTDAPNFDFSATPSNPNTAGNTNDGESFGVQNANMLLGNYNTVTQSNGVFFGAFRFHQFEMYGQDTWKVNHKFTLDYGLRWAYLGPTYTVQPFFANYFDPGRYNPAQAVTINTTPGNYFGDICTLALSALPGGNSCVGLTNYGNPYNGIVQEGTNGIPPGYAKHRYDNFGPRLGFAYDVSGDGKTAIRGGIGIYYERVRQNGNSFDLLGNPPLTYTPTIFAGNVDNLSSAAVSGGALSPVTLLGFDKAGQVPTYYAYSLGVQRELPKRFSLEIAYVGNMGRHEQYQTYLNSVPLGTYNTIPSGTPVAALYPYKGFTDIDYTFYGGNSNYNALQAKLTRRFHSLTLTADYTYSKAIDLTDSDYGGSADTGGLSRTDYLNNPKYDYATAGFNHTHVFNVNYVYALPEFRRGDNRFLHYATGGWELAGITSMWSGSPLDLSISGTSGTLAGPAVYRPNYNGGSIYPSGHPGLEYFNPAVFSAPAPGTLGNVPRNLLTGPGFDNWNISVYKTFQFTESMRLQLRLETFNTFNHTQFTLPGGAINLSSGTPGLLNGTRDPRNVQLGIKFYF